MLGDRVQGLGALLDLPASESCFRSHMNVHANGSSHNYFLDLCAATSAAPASINRHRTVRDYFSILY